MITIIEGTDATGKTTFAKKFAEDTGAKYIHGIAPTAKNWVEEYVLSFNPNEKYVLDRWHIGEMIWPKYFGRESLFPNMFTFNCCNLMLSTLKTEIIIVKRDENEIINTLKERGEQDQIETVISAQTDFLNLAPQIQHVPTIIIDSNDLLNGLI